MNKEKDTMQGTIFYEERHSRLGMYQEKKGT